MSVDPEQLQPQDPNQPSLFDEASVDTTIPHSGEPVRREFDNTKLGERYSLEDLADPAKVAEIVPDTPELTKDELAHGLTLPDTRPLSPPKTTTQETPAPKKGLGKFIAGGVAVAALAGGAAAFALKGSGEAETQATQPAAVAPATNPTEVVPTNPGEVTITVPAVETPVSVTPDDNSIENTPETKEYAPVLMNGTSAEEVIDQLYDNYLCMTNASDPEVQAKCFNYMFGSGVYGELSNGYRTIMSEAIDYREYYPEYEQNVTYKVLDSRYSDQEVIAVVEVATTHKTPDGIVEDQTGTGLQRITFRRGEVTIQQAAVEDKVVPTWLLREVENLTPGETTIE